MDLSDNMEIECQHSNSKKFKCLYNCLENGLHSHMLQYTDKADKVFEIRLTDKKSPKWVDDDISMFRDMDATSSKKHEHPIDAEKCKARGKANFQKFCSSKYLEDLGAEKLKGTPYTFHKYRLLKCPADEKACMLMAKKSQAKKVVRVNQKRVVQGNLRKALAYNEQKSIVAPVIQICAVETCPKTGSLRVSFIPCGSGLQDKQNEKIERCFILTKENVIDSDGNSRQMLIANNNVPINGNFTFMLNGGNTNYTQENVGGEASLINNSIEGTEYYLDTSTGNFQVPINGNSTFMLNGGDTNDTQKNVGGEAGLINNSVEGTEHYLNFQYKDVNKNFPVPINGNSTFMLNGEDTTYTQENVGGEAGLINNSMEGFEYYQDFQFDDANKKFQAPIKGREAGLINNSIQGTEEYLNFKFKNVNENFQAPINGNSLLNVGDRDSKYTLENAVEAGLRNNYVQDIADFLNRETFQNDVDFKDFKEQNLEMEEIDFVYSKELEMLDDKPYEKDYSDKLLSQRNPVLSTAWGNTKASTENLSEDGCLQYYGSNMWMDTFSPLE